MFVAAPALTVVYGAVRLVDGWDGERGPGLAWTGGHLAFLAALALFAVALWEMRRRAGGGALATLTAGAALVGVACSIAQFVIDLVVGARAADHAAMSPMFAAVKDVPGVELAVYVAGPLLFYVGLLVAACHLAALVRLPAWAAGCVVLGVLTPFGGLDLLPVAGILMTLGLAPLARRAEPSFALTA
ncbi:hypothetical protein [Actinocorallia sp. A-T 12471]|uniref:hypothetical protein n=1 Tax=Actinocorallia sp. A-T 12471 TaxID=3089813 RepID=UPI0029D0E9DD|nr:hypothetical protein [Actinocorallia sp. A-T 12471]MDX6741379.1 hypothetical protein [Actinocorallia sp. A-T 12471]